MLVGRDFWSLGTTETSGGRRRMSLPGVSPIISRTLEPAAANSSRLLDFRPAVPTEVPMRMIGLVLLALGVLAAPLTAEAQQAEKVWRIGYLPPFALPNNVLLGALRQSLRDLGYVEGRNIVIEARSAEQRYGDLPKLATELVNANV